MPCAPACFSAPASTRRSWCKTGRRPITASSSSPRRDAQRPPVDARNRGRPDLVELAPLGREAARDTPRRGCSGLAYSVDYVSEETKFDEKIETPGGVFYIDGASVLYLIGSTMDWVEDDFTAGFVFENPNAKGACGCGESFMV